MILIRNSSRGDSIGTQKETLREETSMRKRVGGIKEASLMFPLTLSVKSTIQ